MYPQLYFRVCVGMRLSAVVLLVVSFAGVVLGSASPDAAPSTGWLTMPTFLYAPIGYLSSYFSPSVTSTTTPAPEPDSPAVPHSPIRPIFVSTWVFGHVDDLDLFAETLSLASGLENGVGFIRLVGDGDWLEIEFVQKPTLWPHHESFRSAVLPAAVREFYANTELDIRELTSLHIANAVIMTQLPPVDDDSTPPKLEVAWCYTRLMAAMGIDFSKRKIDTAVVPGGTAILYPNGSLKLVVRNAHLPTANGDAAAALRFAQYHSFVRGGLRTSAHI